MKMYNDNIFITVLIEKQANNNSKIENVTFFYRKKINLKNAIIFNPSSQRVAVK